MKHTSLNIIRYGSVTRHYKTCSRCLRRSAGNGCKLGRYLWARYMQAAHIEKNPQYGVVSCSIYRSHYNV